MRWAHDETYNDCKNSDYKDDLRRNQDNVENPSLKDLKLRICPMEVGVMLPDLESILLEVVLHIPVSTFGFGLFINKALLNRLFIFRELFLNIHSKEQSHRVFICVKKLLAVTIEVNCRLL